MKRNPLHRILVCFHWLLEQRFGGVLLFYLVFLFISLLVRFSLLCRSFDGVGWDPALPSAFVWGFFFDIGAASVISVPFVLVLMLLPQGAFERRSLRIAANVVGWFTLFFLLFGAVAEWVFWSEFESRFNFIAVDYLVYTTEVINNIRESYPLRPIFSALVVLTSLMFFGIVRSGLPHRWLKAAAQPWSRRWRRAAIWLAFSLVMGLVLNQRILPDFANTYTQELAKNGIWSLFAAFRNNELDYRQFYLTLDRDRAFDLLRRELTEDGSRLVDPAADDTLRLIGSEGPEIHPNVIQITVESLSADYLGAYNPESNLTPNLDAIAEKSLVFTNFYATGTRTDRGMEALSLSLPPTPGRSLIKRPHNEHLFTLGSVFRRKGYDTAFLYGGYGYFDNMNYYFGNNGYRLIDRGSVSARDVTFANAWGACDEDLFRWTVREADKSFVSGKPFHFFVMTTSNHRPYTYPEGRIDLPPKISGRQGAVKYTDYAIGQFLQAASTRPWFANTVFVIVADHCASSAGKTELPVEKYHIPLLIFAPGGQVDPGRITTLASQIDYGPTLFGLLSWSYESRFFGHDVRKVDRLESHALIGNYQKIGHIENDVFTILKPLRKHSSYHYDFARQMMTQAGQNEESLEETISYYQTASSMYGNGTYRELPADYRPVR